MTELATPRSRLRLALLLIVPVITIVAGFVGTALSPKLLVEHPALLIALDPRPTHLVLTAPTLSWVTFVALGTARWLIADPFFFIIGAERGPAAVAWMEARSGARGRRTIAFARRMIDRAAYPIAFFASGPLVCVLLGMNGRLDGRRFALVNVVGTLFTMVLIRFVGSQLAGVIQQVTAIIASHVVELTGATCALVVGGLVLRWRRSLASVGS